LKVLTAAVRELLDKYGAYQLKEKQRVEMKK